MNHRERAPKTVVGNESTFTAGDHSSPTIGEARVSAPTIGRYVVDAVLGVGGMGIVHAAWDPTLGRSVALKVIPPGSSSTAAARLVREAQAIARVSHPNVVQVFDAGVEPDGLVYIAMERVDGPTLDVWLKKTPRDARAVVDVFVGAGRGLAAAHSAGLVHRDFKPSNVILADDGRPRVLDFGLARALEARTGDPSQPGAPSALPEDLDISPEMTLTVTGTLIGTPRYMSPEQWQQEPIDARSDQFSYCVALFIALTGRHPFDDSSSAALRASVVSGALPAMPASVPAPLRPIVRRGLARRPADRFASMDELVAALAPPRSYRVRAAAIALAAAGLAAGLAWIAAPSPEAPMPALALAPVATTVVRSYRSQPLTSRGDIQAAALSPDGERLAFIAGDSLYVRGLDPNSEAQLVIAGAVEARNSIAWSPDGQRIVVTTRHDEPGAPFEYRTTVVDVATSARQTFKRRFMYFAMTGDRELAGTSQPSKNVSFLSLDDPDQPTRTCSVPGTYRWMRELAPDGTGVIVQVEHDDGSSSIMRVAGDCTISLLLDHGEAASFIVAPSRGHVLVDPGCDRPLIELDASGRPTGIHHRLGSDFAAPIGARQDSTIVYAISRYDWRLVRIDRAGARQELAWGSSPSELAVSSDGTAIAHIDRVRTHECASDRDAPPGLLRIRRMSDLQAPAPVVASNIHTVAWSPDGTRLAAVAREPRSGVPSLAVIDPARGAVSYRHLPWLRAGDDIVWLDDRRVALHPAGNQTFRSVDVDSGQEQDLLDASAGWPFYATRSRRDGALAFFWNRKPEPYVWLLEPGSAPRPLVPATRDRVFDWSFDGASLLIFEGTTGRGRQVSRSGRTLGPLPTIELPAGTELHQVVAIQGGVLAHTIRDGSDLAMAIPE